MTSISHYAKDFVNSPINQVYFYTGDESNQGIYIDTLIKARNFFIELMSTIPHQRVGGDLFTFKLLVETKVIQFNSISQNFFAPSKWDAKKTLVWFGGANATDLEKQIGSKSKELYQFWERGGKIVAECGSAFWLTKKRCYQFSSNLPPIVKENTNAIFKGEVFGPVKPSPTGKIVHWVSDILWLKDQESFPALVFGGGYFKVTSDKNVEVLATYEDTGEIAALLCYSDQLGALLLTQPHMCFNQGSIDPESFPGPAEEWKEIKGKLVKNEDARFEALAETVAKMVKLNPLRRSANSFSDSLEPIS